MDKFDTYFLFKFFLEFFIFFFINAVEFAFIFFLLKNNTDIFPINNFLHFFFVLYIVTFYISYVTSINRLEYLEVEIKKDSDLKDYLINMEDLFEINNIQSILKKINNDKNNNNPDAVKIVTSLNRYLLILKFLSVVKIALNYTTIIYLIFLQFLHFSAFGNLSLITALFEIPIHVFLRLIVNFNINNTKKNKNH